MKKGETSRQIEIEANESIPAGVSTRDFYFWIRKLHLYLGLFIAPYLLIFALSTLFLNHIWTIPAGADSNAKTWRFIRQVKIPEGAGSVEQAKGIMRQLNVSGEISFISYLDKEKRLIFPVMKPGIQTRVEVDLQTKTAEVEQRPISLWERLVYLHKSPGPHNANIRGNWAYTRLWGILADSVVYMLLFLSIGGIYLWAVIRAERKLGMVLIGCGTASFILIALVLST